MELLIAMLILMVVLMMAEKTLLYFKGENKAMNVTIEKQNTQRFMRQFLFGQIQSAGFTGCLDTKINYHQIDPSLQLSHAQKLNVLKCRDPALKSVSQKVANKCESDSDVIMLYRVNPVTAVVKSLTRDSVIVKSLQPRFKRNDVLILNNCQQADAYKIKKVTVNYSLKRQSVYLVQSIDDVYKEGDIAGLLQRVIIFVGDKHLYQENFRQRLEKLVDGVKTLHAKKFEKGLEVNWRLSDDEPRVAEFIPYAS